MSDGNIQIFIHIVPLGAWKEVFLSIFNQLKTSGLFAQANVFLFLNHDLVHYGDLQQYLAKYPNVQCLHLPSSQVDDFEIPSIHHLKMISDSDVAAQKILYLHLKGISGTADLRQIDWRNFMLWGCVQNWRRCVAMLDTDFDTVGLNFQQHPARHYSGNFWWATSAHIARLPLLAYPHQVEFRQQVPLTSIVDPANPDRFRNYRLDAEFWVCSVPSRNGEIASSPSRNHLGWHYGNYYPIEEYASCT